jgi:anti-sigma factor RsiW
MDCKIAQEKLFRRIDGELPDTDISELDDHLAQCSSCQREYSLLTLPQKLAQKMAPITASPFFYRKLQLHIEEEAQNFEGWQVVRGLARKMVPALAGITLALFSVFAYFQMQAPQSELLGSYDRVFSSDDQSHRMLVAEQKDITYESILKAIAER